MNRTDRLLGIVLELQAKRTLRAEDLAATFEVTKRTIYRDVLALCEAGVPVVAVPGQGYSLVEGYFLPPLSFSADEALMLLLGSDVAAQNFDAQYRMAAQVASHKIVAVLPEHLRQEVEYLRGSIRFIGSRVPFSPETLQILRRAIIQCRTIHFRYFARHGGDASESSLRDADPYALVYASGAWILVAYCHLRHDYRAFRLDRMEEVIVLNQVFIRNPDFKLQRRKEDEQRMIVRVLFDRETARWAREAPSFFQVAQEDTPDGLLVTLSVRQPAEVLNWMLSWGSHVRVLEPDSLREMLAREAMMMLENYSMENLPV